MHVLVLPSELYCPPRQPLLGVFQRHQVELLASRGVQTGVVSFGYIPWRFLLSGFPYSKIEETPGSNVVRQFSWSPLPARFAHSILDKQQQTRFNNLINNYIKLYGKPDIIHAHNCLYAGLAAARISREVGIPFVLTEHNSALQGQTLSLRSQRHIREVLRSAATISAVGSRLAKSLAPLTPTSEKDSIVVLGNLLDPFIEASAKSIAPHPVRTNLESHFTVLAIGALISVKNHQLLLKAFAAAFLGDESARLRIGGEGQLKTMLCDLAIDLGIGSQVDFLGPLTRDQVIDEMSKCDALVSSSLVETFGVVLIEAMAFGRPVVATRCGGPEDIINGENGILVDIDEASLAKGLRDIRKANFDPRIIQEGCFSAYGSDSFFKRLMKLYQTTIECSKMVSYNNIQNVRP